MFKSSLFAASLLASTAALAQAQQSGTQTAVAAVEGAEIIVTAQKREERLIDVPISIIVKTGRELQNAGLNDFNDIAARVPNIVIADTPANKTITIRGIGTTGNSFSFEQSVALFVDGVYGGRNRQYNQPFLDIERLEVLRGPQGALFGRNTAAGAISITTARPSQEFMAEAFGEYEVRTQNNNVTAIMNGGLTDKLSIRVATRYAKDNGWIRNTTLDRDEPVSDQFLGRISLLYQPLDNVDIFGKFEYSKVDIDGSSFEFVRGGERPDYLKDTDDAFAPERDNSQALNGVLQVDVGLGDHTLTAITGYSSYGFDQGFNVQARRPARLVVQNDEQFSQWSQEIRLLSPTDGAFDYVVGGYAEWGRSRVNRESIIDTPAPRAPNTITRRRFDQDTDVLSAFVQGNYRFLEQFSIGGGVRWTQIKKNAELDGSATIFPFPPPPSSSIVIPRALLTGEFTESSFAPSAVLNWQPNRNFNAYVRYARGEKGGAFSEFQNVTADDFILRPETSDLFEAGIKAQFPEIGGFLNVIAYTTQYTDLQKSALDIETASFITSNAAGARTRGVEAEGGFSPFEGVRVSGAIAYLDAFYTSWPNGPCTIDNPDFSTQNCTQDRSGGRPQNAPEWSGNVAVDFDRPVSGYLRIFGNATLNFQSDVNYQEAESALEVQEAFSKTDIRVGVGNNDRNWELALLVRNLFEARTSSLIFNTFPIGVGPNDRVHVPDALRSFTIQARLSF